MFCICTQICTENMQCSNICMRFNCDWCTHVSSMCRSWAWTSLSVVQAKRKKQMREGGRWSWPWKKPGGITKLLEVEIRLPGYQSKRWKKELTQPCTRGDWTWWKAEGLSEKLSSTAILCVRWEQAGSNNYKTQSACLQLNARNSGRNFGPSSITHHPRSKIVAQKEIFETCAAATVPFSCRMSILQCLQWMEILASNFRKESLGSSWGPLCTLSCRELCWWCVFCNWNWGHWSLVPITSSPSSSSSLQMLQPTWFTFAQNQQTMCGEWVGRWVLAGGVTIDTAWHSNCNCWKVTKIAPQEVLYLEIVQRESCCVTQDCNKEANRERQELNKVMKKKEEDTEW